MEKNNTACRSIVTGGRAFWRGLLVSGAMLLAATWGGAAASEHAVFAVAAGRAEIGIKQVAQQAGRPVVFPSELVRDVRTNAVHGELTCQEALEQLLAGTGLEGREDAATGAIVVTRRSEAEKIVELPPYVVEERATPVWRYAAAPGAEILTRVSDDVTEDIVGQCQRMQQLLDVILPKRLQFSLPTPTLYVFFNARGQSEALNELVNRLGGEVESHQPAEKVAVRPIPNYRFWDPDLLAIFFAVDERRIEPQQLMLAPDYVRYVLENRTPTLPRWFVEGFVELYGSVLMTTRPLRSTEGLGSALPNSRPVEENITLLPATWISKEETATVRKYPWRARKLPPLRTLFSDARGGSADDPDARAWTSEAALFIRWCVEDTRANGRRDALWKMVEQASGGPGVSEALFKACFARDYATAEKQLRDYRDTAVRTTVKLEPNELAEPLALPLQDATDAEIARVKGALDRLEIGYVKERYPELTDQYVAQARRTLRRAYDRGVREPRLLAELGLCEVEAGDDTSAEPLLGAALDAGVTRPRVAYELARLRYRAARERGFGLTLTAPRLAEVIALLNRARRQSPPMVEVYELLAEVWLREETRLAPAELAMLDEGVRLFSRSWRLLYSAAMLNELNGNRVRAQELTQRGLAFAGDERVRGRLLKLQAVLAGEHGNGPQKNRGPEAAVQR